MILNILLLFLVANNGWSQSNEVYRASILWRLDSQAPFDNIDIEREFFGLEPGQGLLLSEARFVDHDTHLTVSHSTPSSSPQPQLAAIPNSRPSIISQVSDILANSGTNTPTEITLTLMGHGSPGVHGYIAGENGLNNTYYHLLLKELYKTIRDQGGAERTTLNIVLSACYCGDLKQRIESQNPEDPMTKIMQANQDIKTNILMSTQPGELAQARYLGKMMEALQAIRQHQSEDTKRGPLEGLVKYYRYLRLLYGYEGRANVNGTVPSIWSNFFDIAERFDPGEIEQTFRQGPLPTPSVNSLRLMTTRELHEVSEGMIFVITNNRFIDFDTNRYLELLGSIGGERNINFLRAIISEQIINQVETNEGHIWSIKRKAENALEEALQNLTGNDPQTRCLRIFN